MTRTAPTSTRIDLRNCLSRFDETGVALWNPDFGSVLRHSGQDALDLLHRITTNSLIDLPDGSARQTILTSEKGRIIDAPWVIKLAPDELLLISDGPYPQALQAGILRYTIIEDAELIDITDETTRVMVFGEQATQSMIVAFPEADFSRASDLVELGEDRETISLRTDAAGVTTWLIIAPRDTAEELSSRFDNLDIAESDRTLFEFVRVRNGAPIVGHELTEDVNPLEASMRHLIDFDKGCYVGQEVVARLDTYDKVQRELVAFNEVHVSGDGGEIEIDDRIMATKGGREVGWVSSVATDPATGSTFGMAYVRGRYVDGGDIMLASGGDGIALLT